MKYYIDWIATIATISCPFLCFLAALLNLGNDLSTLYLLLGLFSLDSMINVKFPKRDNTDTVTKL